MIDPSKCVHPEEHLQKINGDVKQCEFCGVLLVYNVNTGKFEPKKKK